MVRLNRTYYSLLKLQAKFSKSPQSNSSELHKFRAVRPHSPRITQNLHHLITLHLMFQAPAPAENTAEFQRITQIPRSSPTQSANYAKFAHFVNIFYLCFRHLPSTENQGKLERINKIPLNSPTYYANYANSAHFAVN